MEARQTTGPDIDILKAFEELPEGTRAELIDGVIVDMGSPSGEHQDIAGGIFAQLFVFLRGKACKARYEFDVQLDESNPRCVFRPDIVIVCDPSKLRENRVVGAPDLIIEVVSPSSRGRDSIMKLNRYRDAGVREYWIVDPQMQAVQQLILENSRYYATAYGPDARVPVSVLAECEVDLTLVFPEAE